MDTLMAHLLVRLLRLPIDIIDILHSIYTTNAQYFIWLSMGGKSAVPYLIHCFISSIL